MENSLRSVRDDRPALRKALELAGYVVFEASDGSHDMGSLRVFLAALILFDLPMPRVGGLEVIRRLRETGDRDPEVVILTYDRIHDTIAALRLGVVDVLVKPLKPDALHAAVEEIIRRADAPRPASGWTRRKIFVAVQPSMIDRLRAANGRSGYGHVEMRQPGETESCTEEGQ